MRCDLVRAIGGRVAIRRRQSQAAVGEDQEGTFPDTFLCAARVSRAPSQDDRSRSQQTLLGTHLFLHSTLSKPSIITNILAQLIL